MKKIISFLSIVVSLCLSSCADDDKVSFDTAISSEMFTFKPVEGGAVLQYKLSDPRITKVKAEYKDEFNEPIYKVGDYSVDTLLLDGFNSVNSNVPVKVSFMDRNGNESAIKSLSFNTLASNLHTFFDHVRVSSYWEGFQITYELEGLVNGSATVYFVGENPNTHARDTLTLENFQLESGKYTKAYTLDASQQQSSYTVMITTEDNKQRIAKKKVWTGIVGVEREMLPNSNFELYDPFGKSKEVDYNPYGYNPGALSKKYLFDGDTKGTQAIAKYAPGSATPPYTFLAGPDALHTVENDVYFVLDIKQPAMLGEMRFYAKYRDGGATNMDFGNNYSSYFINLPCAVKVYAWTASEAYNPNADQTQIPATNWKLMGSYMQDSGTAIANRWYANKEGNITDAESLEQLKKLDPLYLSVPFEFSEEKFRYYKIEFEATYKDIYSPESNYNANNQVTCHEIEVYAKKEE